MTSRFDLFRPWRRRFGDHPVETVIRLALAASYLSLIFFASHIPGDDIPGVVDDRIAHTVAYFGVGIVIMLAIAGFTRESVGPRHFALGWVLGVGYGISDELHQMYVPGRTSELRDVFFDALGVSLGIALVWLGTRKRR